MWRAAALALTAGLAGAQAFAPPSKLLTQIRERVSANLQQLPNYTCVQTIERSVRTPAWRRFELVDVVRVEVALVNQREMFAWPGSDRFDDRDITEMVKGGAIGNGMFATHIRSVVLGYAPDIQERGEELHEGKRTYRFDYEVPRARSGYTIRVQPQEAPVGYEGSFWVDPESLDVLSMSVRITDVPPELPVRGGHEMLRRQWVKISGSDFLLPLESESVLEGRNGVESRNVTRLSRCRLYAGESVVRFEDVDATVAAAAKPPEEVKLPGGLEVELALEGVVTAGESAVGDPVQATVARDVKKKGAVILPKGAKVSGRIVRMRRVEGLTYEMWTVGFHFTRVEYPQHYAVFLAKLEDAVSRLPRRRGDLISAGPLVDWKPPDDPQIDPHVGILYMRGTRPKLNAGVRTWWRTEASRPIQSREQ